MANLTGPILVKHLPRLKTTVVTQITLVICGVIPQNPANAGNSATCATARKQSKNIKVPLHKPNQEKDVNPGQSRVHISTLEMIKVLSNLTGPILVKHLPRLKTTVVTQITLVICGVIPQNPANAGNSATCATARNQSKNIKVPLHKPNQEKDANPGQSRVHIS